MASIDESLRAATENRRGIVCKMNAATSTDSVPGDAEVDTVWIEFSLDSDKQHGVTGDLVSSPLVPAGSGYVC